MVSTTRASAVTITDRARTVNAGRTILSCFSSYLRVRISGKLLEGGIRDISHIVGATLVKPGNQVAGTHLLSSSECFIVLCMAEVSGSDGCSSPEPPWPHAPTPSNDQTAHTGPPPGAPMIWRFLPCRPMLDQGESPVGSHPVPGEESVAGDHMPLPYGCACAQHLLRV